MFNVQTWTSVRWEAMTAVSLSAVRTTTEVSRVSTSASPATSPPLTALVQVCRASVACSHVYSCESWTLRKNEETRLEAFEMKGLRKILRISWTAKKTNEWVLNKAGVKRQLLDTVKARKLAYCGHTMRKQGNYLEKEIMQGTMPGVRSLCRPG